MLNLGSLAVIWGIKPLYLRQWWYDWLFHWNDEKEEYDDENESHENQEKTAWNETSLEKDHTMKYNYIIQLYY